MATDLSNGPDPFAAQGGGQFVQGVGWVDKNNPAYTGPAGGTNAANSGTASPNGDPNQTPSTVPGQPAATTSSTPGAAPTGPTTNQGTQDTVRNTYLAQASQPEVVTPNDPNVKAQTDAYRAEATRGVNNYLDQQAESAGPYATGALRGQARMANEQAGQATGAFETQLMANELAARRQEIQNALSGLGGLVTSDQQQALQKELADIDAQTKVLGINTAASTAANQLGVQQELGVGGLNLGLIQALLGNQQFGNNLALQAAIAEMGGNTTAGNAVSGA